MRECRRRFDPDLLGLSAGVVTVGQAEELRRIVAEFLEVDAASIGPETRLGGPNLSSSLARAGLDAALRKRLGIKSPAVYTALRYGDLEAAACGESAASDRGSQHTSPAPPVVPGSGSGSGSASASASASASLEPVDRGVRCGIDVEEIDALPGADDYWEHEFYRLTFTDAEIAYCLAQAEPRQHFAARWAAKEAVRKLAPEYLKVESNDLEVIVQANGAPRMALRGAALPIDVSLAHTGAVAVAVAVTLPSASGAGGHRVDEAKEVASPPERLRKGAARPSPASRLSQLLLPALTIAALGIAAWALLRTFG
jgi:holo-[acyl-carrier protein] synthase